MKIELIWWEIKKLWQLRTWMIFLVLCLAFNFLLVAESGAFSEDGAYVAYVGEVTRAVGNQMGGKFTARVRTLPETPYRDRLLSETTGASDIFADYETGELYAYYVGNYHIGGFVAEALARKYEGLQRRVEALAARGASLSVGAAGMTDHVLEYLFAWLCPALLTETILLSVLLALYASGGEQANHTQHMVYVTRRGRQIQIEKMIAALVSAEAAYILLVGASVGIFAASWRLGEAWQMDMASQFYLVRDLGVEMPFVAWADFTLAGYMAAVAALGALVILLFGLLGLCAGLATKNSYRGFLLLFVCMALNFWGLFFSGNSGFWGMYEVMQWTPAAVWSSVPLWLSGLNLSVLVPWQDVKAVLVCLLAAGGLLMAARYRFARCEIYG